MIDPSFWTDEKVGECSIQERLLYIGLISNADDEGYGRANPKLLKSLVFPYDDLRASDLEKWLSHLGGLNMVVLYECDEQTYYYLPNFLKHQTINRPTKSVFPSIEDKKIKILSEYSMSTHESLTPKRNKKEDKRKEEKRNIIVDIYNSSCTNLPKIQKITEKRQKMIEKFLKEFSPEQFNQICLIANTSDFLIGKNNRGWKADFDFLMRVDKATAILEGKYSNNIPKIVQQTQETEEEKLARKTRELEEAIKNANK